MNSNINRPPADVLNKTTEVVARHHQHPVLRRFAKNKRS